MGCDIHPIIEVKDKKEQEWEGVANGVYPGRNYVLFGVLAGVRCNATEIDDPRGLPKDLSFEGKYYFMKEDTDDWDSLKEHYHSASFVLFNELKKHKLGKLEAQDFGVKTQFWQKCDFYLMMEALAKKYGAKNVRLVFAFDN